MAQGLEVFDGTSSRQVALNASGANVLAAKVARLEIVSGAAVDLELYEGIVVAASNEIWAHPSVNAGDIYEIECPVPAGIGLLRSAGAVTVRVVYS